MLFWEGVSKKDGEGQRGEGQKERYSYGKNTKIFIEQEYSVVFVFSISFLIIGFLFFTKRIQMRKKSLGALSLCCLLSTPLFAGEPISPASLEKLYEEGKREQIREIFSSFLGKAGISVSKEFSPRCSFREEVFSCTSSGAGKSEEYTLGENIFLWRKGEKGIMCDRISGTCLSSKDVSQD